jgi:hypothetical protein
LWHDLATRGRKVRVPGGYPDDVAATAYEFLKARGASPIHENWTDLAVAFLISAVVAFIAVRWLLRYCRPSLYGIRLVPDRRRHRLLAIAR